MSNKVFLLILTCVTFLVICGGSVSIIGSRSVTHGENYEVLITNYNKDAEKELILKLDGDSFGDVDEKSLKLDFDETKVTFNLAEHSFFENFTLTATIPNTDFNQSVNIHTIYEPILIYIETDKSIYKPGDKIQLHVFVFDNQTRPYQADELSVTIVDGVGSTVYKQNAIEYKEDFVGVFEAEIETSEDAMLGAWKVVVFKDEKIVGTKAFEVAELVPHHFTVFAASKHPTLSSENVLKLEVFSEYSFGLFVRGKAVITPTIVSDVMTWSAAAKSVEISSKEIIEFSLIDDLNITESQKAFVTFNIEFEEAFTGVKSFRNLKTLVINGLEIVQQEKKFEPGFPFAFQVKLHDEKLSKEDEVIVTVDIILYFEQKCADLSHSLDDNIDQIILESLLINGTADFSFDVPMNISEIAITANFLEISTSMNLMKAPTKAREALKMEVITKRPRVGDEIRVKVESTAVLAEIHWILLHGSKILSSKINQAIWKKEDEFSFQATDEMKPSVNVVAFYVHSNGDVVKEEVAVKIKDNHDDVGVHIEVSPILLAPGETCTISITTNPDSVVSLIAVDRKILIGVEDPLERLDSLQRFQTIENKIAQLNLASNSFVMTSAAQNQEMCLSLRLGDDSVTDNLKNPELPRNPDEERLRQDFPEAWIFETAKADGDGRVSVTKTVPDSATTWSVAAISIHPKYGLQLSQIHNVTVAQQFFVQLRLPYSVRYHEVLKIDALVFNYIPNQEDKVEVDVTLYRTDEGDDFEFIESFNDCSFVSHLERELTVRVSIAPNSTGSASFLIRPIKTGKLPLKVKAQIESAEIVDEVEETLKVEHEVETSYVTRSLLIDLRKSLGIVQHQFEISIPDEAIKKSVRFEGAVTGNLLGSTKIDAEALIKTPTTSMLFNYIESMLSLKFLSDVNQAPRSDIQGYLQTGYKYIQDRRNADGSFSFEGHGIFKSMFSSAYVIKCLSQLSSLITINEQLIKDAASFLKQHQGPEGLVDAKQRSLAGCFIDVDVGGEQNSGIYLTAFVAISFLENSNLTEPYKEVVDRAMTYLNHNTMFMSRNLDVAITAYAMGMAKHNTGEALLSHLKSKMVVEQDKHYWNADDDNSGDFSTRLEIASYAVLAYLKTGQEPEIMPIMLWIVSQIHENEGKISTVAYQALAEVTKVFFHSEARMDLHISFGSSRSLEIHIDKSKPSENFELPSNVRNFSIQSKGTGFATLQISHKYDTIIEEVSDKFSLSIAVNPTGDEKLLHLTISTSFKIDDDDDEELQNLRKEIKAVMEVELPRGFSYDHESTELLMKLNVKKIETRNAGNVVSLHFDKLTDTNVRLEIRAIRERELRPLKRSVVKIYHEEKRAVEYYTIKGSQYCIED